jgi:hypothetical protein
MSFVRMAMDGFPAGVREGSLGRWLVVADERMRLNSGARV